MKQLFRLSLGVITVCLLIGLFISTGKTATLTPNLSLQLPSLGETGWGPMLNSNSSILDALFGTSSGHGHTGVAGQGPKINLTTAVTGVLPAANGGVTILTAGSIPFSNGSILTQDNANLFWDDTNNRVGIGVTTPATILEAVTSTAAERVINGTYGASDANGFIFRFRKNRSGAIVQNGDLLGEIYWTGLQSAASYVVAATISSAVDGTPGAVNDMPSRLVFSTTPDGSGTATEAMRIDKDGKVGIGTAASPTSKLGVSTAANDGISVTDGTVRGILFTSSGTQATIGTTTNHPLSFFTNNSEKAAITAAGIVTVGAVNTTSAGAADIVLPNSTGELRGANAAGTDTVPLISLNSSNLVSIGQHTFVKKTSAESVNNSSTVQNDDALLWAVGANETWAFDMYLSGVTDSPDGDFKFNLGVPASATYSIGCSSYVVQDGAMTTSLDDNIVIGANDAVECKGVVITAGTSGTVNFKWSQLNAVVGNTTVGIGSWLQARRIA